jgi:hypothetical protein
MPLESRAEKNDPVIVEFVQRFAALESRLAVLETELKYLKSDVRMVKYLLIVYIASTILAAIILKVVP